MRKENSSFVTKFISEPGSYLVNSDYFAFVELKDYACYVIADGIDTDEKKESAKLAITTVITQFSENPGMSAGKLKQYMQAAHNALLGEADQIRLEASMAILLTDYKKAIWAHAGNCRVYWMRNGSIKEVTKDTSLSQKMVDEEEVPLDQLSYHAERNNLYTYLGQPDRFTPVLSGKKKLEDGDIFIMQTRGVWEHVGEAELIDAIEGVSKPEDVCTGLEDVILSQRLEVVENYTIATVFVDKIYNNPKAGKYKKYIKIGISIAFAILMIAFSILFAQYRKNKSSIAKMDKYKERGIEYLQKNNYGSADEQISQAYAISENIKARKNSKNYEKVKVVELFDKMSDSLKLATDALQEKEYKKASRLFEGALANAEELRNQYGEDVSLYLEAMKKYQEYAYSMYQATEGIKNANYDSVADYLRTARNLMNDIDDTGNRDVADELLRNVSGKDFMVQGEGYLKEGKEYYNNGSYAQAQTMFEAAKAAFEKAADCGVQEASARISSADIELNTVKNMSSQQSNQDIEREADELLNKGNQALHDEKYEDAKEYYQKAKDLFIKTNNNEQIIVINGKLENIQYGPDEKQAREETFVAMEAMARGDMAQAIIHLNNAKNAYKKANDTESANRIQAILNQMNP